MKFIITEEQIEKRVQELAQEIYLFFKEKNIDFIYFIFILTSSFVFASDLMRALSQMGLKIQTDVISVKSYLGTKSNTLIVNPDDIYRQNLNNKRILIVDDILDTGKTLTYVREQILKTYNPNLLEFCCLLEKESNSRNLNFDIKFIGFKIPDVFVVGYGLDYNGRFRELAYITEIDQIKE